MRRAYLREPCPHYPERFKTEAAHIGTLAAKKRYYEKLCAARKKKRFASDLYPLRLRLQRLLCTIRQRVTRGRYAEKGIQLRLTFSDLVFVWERDGADKMKRPSIDRIDNDGHYELRNVRFIELIDNIRRGIQVRDAEQAARRGKAA